MQPISLLLVDDNPRFLQVLTRFLHVRFSDEVVTVGTAGGGMEALVQAQNLRPQVILLDLVMPGLSGLDLIPRLRKSLPGVRIIVLTVFDSNGYRQAALEAGADAFVTKEALNTDLVPAILAVMRNGRPQTGTDDTEADQADR
jgi:DNA-binding NarL/FixJ family response regulator